MLRNAASLNTYPTSTWAGLPAAASAQGQIVRVSDIGVAGVGLLMISDGVRWLPLGPQLLARSAVAASVTGTTNETALATVTVPAGILGLSGAIEVRTSWSMTNSANTKSLRVRFGGIGGVAYLAAGLTASANASDTRRIRNRNNAASQVGSFQAATVSSGGTGTGALPTDVLNTAVNQDVVITGQLALGTETMALETSEVWVTP